MQEMDPTQFSRARTRSAIEPRSTARCIYLRDLFSVCRTKCPTRRAVIDLGLAPGRHDSRTVAQRKRMGFLAFRLLRCHHQCLFVRFLVEGMLFEVVLYWPV